MKKLQKEVKKNGFTYNLIKRNEAAAMYEVEVGDGIDPYYETFRIRVAKESETIMDGKAIKFEAHERFPSNEDFGKTAWCHRTRDKAETKYAEISVQGTPTGDDLPSICGLVPEEG